MLLITKSNYYCVVFYCNVLTGSFLTENYRKQLNGKNVFNHEQILTSSHHHVSAKFLQTVKHLWCSHSCLYKKIWSVLVYIYYQDCWANLPSPVRHWAIQRPSSSVSLDHCWSATSAGLADNWTNKQYQVKPMANEELRTPGSFTPFQHVVRNNVQNSWCSIRNLSGSLYFTLVFWTLQYLHIHILVSMSSFKLCFKVV